MLSSLACRAVTTVLGFVWPAYQCFKDIEHKTGNQHQWCIYWIVIVLYTALERIADIFVFWLPLYSEFKIGLVCFLSCANGADYVYNKAVSPLLKQHEQQIDDTIATGKAWVHAHISSNMSWVGEWLQTKMISMISAVHQFQKDHNALKGSHVTEGNDATQNSTWQIPPVSTGAQPASQADPAAKVTKRRFGFR